MDLRVSKEIKKIEKDKKCGALTCLHYAAGYCVGCPNDNDCEFVEGAFTQE